MVVISDSLHSVSSIPHVHTPATKSGAILRSPRALARAANLYHRELAEYGHHAPALETSQITD